MRRIRRIGTAAMLAAVLAVGMSLSTATLEAKKKGGGGDPQDAICSYLLNVITYPYVNEYIKQFALSLYSSYGCDPALLP